MAFVRFGIDVLVRGRPLPKYQDEHGYFILGCPGDQYQIRLCARGPRERRPVVTEVFVDGQSVLCPPSRVRVLSSQLLVRGFEKRRLVHGADEGGGPAHRAIEYNELVFSFPDLRDDHAHPDLGSIRAEIFEPFPLEKFGRGSGCSTRFPNEAMLQPRQGKRAHALEGRMTTREGQRRTTEFCPFEPAAGAHMVLTKGEHVYTLVLRYFQEPPLSCGPSNSSSSGLDAISLPNLQQHTPLQDLQQQHEQQQQQEQEQEDLESNITELGSVAADAQTESWPLTGSSTIPAAAPAGPTGSPSNSSNGFHPFCPPNLQQQTPRQDLQERQQQEQKQEEQKQEQEDLAANVTEPGSVAFDACAVSEPLTMSSTIPIRVPAGMVAAGDHESFPMELEVRAIRFDGAEYGNEYIVVKKGDTIRRIPHPAEDTLWTFVCVERRAEDDAGLQERGWYPTQYLQKAVTDAVLAATTATTGTAASTNDNQESAAQPVEPMELIHEF